MAVIHYLPSHHATHQIIIFILHAGHGGNGGGDGLTGRAGADLYVKVPLGTIITEKLTDAYLDSMNAQEASFSEVGEGNTDFSFDMDDYSLPTMDLDKDRVVHSANRIPYITCMLIYFFIRLRF